MMYTEVIMRNVIQAIHMLCCLGQYGGHCLCPICLFVYLLTNLSE